MWRTATLKTQATTMAANNTVIDPIQYLDFLDQNGGQADQTTITRKFRNADTLSTRDDLVGSYAIKVDLVRTRGRTKEVITMTDAGQDLLAKARATVPAVVQPVPTTVPTVTTSFLPSLPNQSGLRCPSCGQPVAPAAVATVCPRCRRLVGPSLPPPPPRQDCPLCGHWHEEEPEDGCSCCARSYDNPDAMFAVHEPTARDVLWAVATSGQAVTRQDVITRFKEEYQPVVADLFDVLVRDGALGAVGHEESSEALYSRPSPRDLPPTPDDTPITLAEVADYVRALPVPNNLWSHFVARALRPVDRDYYVAPGVKANDDDRRALRPIAQRPVRSELMRDPQTGRNDLDPNSVYAVHERAVEAHLRTLCQMGWIAKGELPNWYAKTRSTDRLLAEGRATPI
jgi:hypothetical protein